MVGGKQIILVFLFLQPLLSQEEDCDPVFNDCEDTYTDNEECDDVRRSFILVNCHLKFILRFSVMTILLRSAMISLMIVETVSPSMKLMTQCSTGKTDRTTDRNDARPDISVSPKPFFRQAFQVCETEPCSDFADLGYVCAPVWTCTNNTVITDGKVSTHQTYSSIS